MISMNSKERKLREKNMKELQDKIKEKEREVHKAGNRKKKMTKLKLLQEQLNYQINRDGKQN